jgi:hypothetical protein
MLTCAHVKVGIKKVLYVLSNARDVRKIRRRQFGAKIKRHTVKRSGVRVQTVRVTGVSNHGSQQKQRHRHRVESMSTSASRDTAECEQCGWVSLVRWLVGAQRMALLINRVLGVLSL